MGGYPYGGDRVALKILRGKKKRLLHRVIMIGQVPANLLDWHVIQAGAIQDLAGGFCAADARLDADLHVFVIGRHQLELGVKSENHARNHKKKPGWVKYHKTLSTGRERNSFIRIPSI